MFVTVIHRIHDPAGFEAAEAKALEAGLPSHVALPIHAATNDHGLGICIWEGASVEAVSDAVEGLVVEQERPEHRLLRLDRVRRRLELEDVFLGRRGRARRRLHHCHLGVPFSVTVQPGIVAR